MIEIDPTRFVFRCLFEPSQNSVFREIYRWWRGETPRF